MRWSDKALERFTAAIEQAREEGFSGQQALNRAHAILWPKASSSVIDTAIHDDDVDFVEQCVLKAFDSSDPIYVVGVSYYTTRKKISDITRELQRLAPGSRQNRQGSALNGAFRYSGQRYFYRQELSNRDYFGKIT